MSHYEYVVHAESQDLQKLGKHGLVQGGRVIPDGLVHGARVDDQQTLCRRPTLGLRKFREQPFEHYNRDLCCPECLEEYAALE